MYILGIDTSCDDTCASLIKFKIQKSKVKIDILSNIVSSQVKLHAQYGGVYPSLAKREHQKNLPLVFKKATKGIDISNIDLIGVTTGPGLEPCLWQGVNFAKELAEKSKKPLIPANHIEAHILANFIDGGFIDGGPTSFKSKTSLKSKIFPAVCLVVSGGHTQLILMKGIGEYTLIGETRDDAAGECFDKAARILALGYPGGPAIDAGAAKYRDIGISKQQVKLPRPMIYTKDYDFSFSGLKTAVLYEVKNEKRKTKNKKYIQEMCFEVQQAIIDVLIHKTLKAVKNYRAKAIILGGGVAASEELRKQFRLKVKSQMPKIKLLVPPKILCRDNAAMVGITAYFNQSKKKNWQKISADANLRIG